MQKQRVKHCTTGHTGRGVRHSSSCADCECVLQAGQHAVGWSESGSLDTAWPGTHTRFAVGKCAAVHGISATVAGRCWSYTALKRMQHICESKLDCMHFSSTSSSNIDHHCSSLRRAICRPHLSRRYCQLAASRHLWRHRRWQPFLHCCAQHDASDVRGTQSGGGQDEPLQRLVGTPAGKADEAICRRGLCEGRLRRS